MLRRRKRLFRLELFVSTMCCVLITNIIFIYVQLFQSDCRSFTSRKLYVCLKTCLCFLDQSDRAHSKEKLQLIERLSLTLLGLQSNGKWQKWNFRPLSLALWTVEWKYLYLWRIVGDIFLFLCFNKGLEAKNTNSEVIFAVCRLPFDVRPRNVKLNLSNNCHALLNIHSLNMTDFPYIQWVWRQQHHDHSQTTNCLELDLPNLYINGGIDTIRTFIPKATVKNRG